MDWHQVGKIAAALARAFVLAVAGIIVAQGWGILDTWANAMKLIDAGFIAAVYVLIRALDPSNTGYGVGAK